MEENPLLICGDNEREIMKLYKHNCKSRIISSLNPAIQYQTQKRIQNTCRVQSSLYTMNLAAVSTYQRPSSVYLPVQQNDTIYIVPPRVNWNQMSDRSKPSNYTNTKPNGVDIKYNSYNRYLNRLKGKGPVKRGPIPSNYGTPIPFNRAYPIYGGKTVKTAIINGPNCVCPYSTDDVKFIANEILPHISFTSNTDTDSNNANFDIYIPTVGDIAWVLPNINSIKEYKAVVLNVDIATNMATVRLTKANQVITVPLAFISKYSATCNIVYKSSDEMISQDDLVNPLTGSINSVPLCEIITQATSSVLASGN